MCGSSAIVAIRDTEQQLLFTTVVGLAYSFMSVRQGRVLGYAVYIPNKLGQVTMESPTDEMIVSPQELEVDEGEESVRAPPTSSHTSPTNTERFSHMRRAVLCGQSRSECVEW